MPGHLRYTCCPGTHATVVGFLLWDSTIRYVTRDALLAWPTTMLAWPTTKRCASHTRRLERDRSLSIARGPLRAWRASAPARRRGTRAEYERESVNVTSVCGTTCERGGASLGARVGMSQVAALLLRDSKPTRMLSKPTRILSGSFGKDRPRCRPFICVSQERQEQRRLGAAARGDDGRAPLDRCALKVRQARPHISTRRRRARSAG